MSLYCLLADGAVTAANPGLWEILWNALIEVGKFLGHYLVGGMIPAFFIAGAIGSFIPKEFILKYLGKNTPGHLSYPTATVAGGILSVCSCGIIPIFVSIYTTGAGIGPAITFLFAGPAINMVAIFYTQAVIGTEMMLVRTFAALFGALLCGVLFRCIFTDPPAEETVELKIKTRERRTAFQTIFFMAMLILVMLIGSNPGGRLSLQVMFGIEALLIGFVVMLTKKWLDPAEVAGWLDKTWSLFVRIMPKVVLGIFGTHVVLGLLPLQNVIYWIMGQGPLVANLISGLIGSFVYFGTIVGVNIVHTLQLMGLGHGPALTLFVTGPVVSLSSLLPIYDVLGFHRTLVYWVLVVLIGTTFGVVYGSMAPLVKPG